MMQILQSNGNAGPCITVDLLSRLEGDDKADDIIMDVAGTTYIGRCSEANMINICL